MGPELFDTEIQGHRRTKYSDCYALGMVIYEVLRGRVPFHQCANWAIPGRVLKGERPGRPQGEGVRFTDDVWELLERCWVAQPKNRPSIGDVLLFLEKVSSSWTSPSLPTTDSLTSDTFEISSDLSTDEDDAITSPLQSSDDLNIDEGEVPPPSQPSNDQELPLKGDADESLRSQIFSSS